MRLTLWLTALLLALPALAANPAADTDGDSIPDRVEGMLGAHVDRADTLVRVQDDPAGDASGGALDFVSLDAAHLGGDRWLFAVGFAEPVDPRGQVVILYADLDNDQATGRTDKPEVMGTDIMYTANSGMGGESVRNPGFNALRPGRARFAFDGDRLYISDDLALEGDRTFRLRLLAQPAEQNGGDSTDFASVTVPRVAGLGAAEIVATSLDRGIPGSAVAPAAERPPFPRERPAAPISAGGKADRAASVERERVSVELLEEQGVDRPSAVVTFGFPLPQGAVFQPTNVRLLDGDAELAADIAATGYWPDDSLRWVLIDAPVALAANQSKRLTVEYGSAVQRELETPFRRSLLSAAPDPAALLPETFELVDADGNLLHFEPEAGVVEYAGSHRAVVRFDGRYVGEGAAPGFAAKVRVTLREGTPRREIAHTLINDVLDHEFTDIRALRMRVPSFGSPELWLGGPDHAAAADAPGALVINSDRTYSLKGTAAEGRPVGAAAVTTPGGALAVTVHDAWQRYPKALSVADESIMVDLLPPLEGAAVPPEDLPDFVDFPFIDGAYRFKWGMASTERVAIEPAAQPWAAALDFAEPVVATVPAEHYERTRALGDMVADRGLFPAWDQAFARAFEDHLTRKDAKREYGYLNWGDWHGEREHNWGNNEYDLPHGLFMQFARTGNRDYYRLALAGARHQADVDMIHAYPDPRVVGGNIPHSVFHNGEWDQNIADRRWSFAYNAMHTAANGHTWSDGMVDAWWLAGDPWVMDAALGLGEHIAWQMAPAFDHLGTHERSAGWSAHAIAKLYRATLDPAYLEALRKIVGVAYAEQDLDETGVWPHVLPPDHAGGHGDVVGNVPFLMGILLEGIEEDWELTGNERAKEALLAAMPWMKAQFVPGPDTFAYSSWPGYRERTTRGFANGNALIIGPMLRAATWGEDPELETVTLKAALALIQDGVQGFGKSLGQAAHFAPQIMARLAELGLADTPAGADLRASLDDLRERQLIAAAAPERLWLRGPVDKRVLFRHGGGPATFEALREPWGAKPKEEPEGTVRVVGPGGETVAEGTFNTDLTDPWTWRAELPADAPAGVYQVLIHDDLRGRWDVRGPGAAVVDNRSPAHFGGPGQVRWQFGVPAGTRAFTVTINGHHEGPYGAVVLDPSGAVAGRARGDASSVPGSRSAKVEVVVPAGQDGKVWSLVVYAGMDLSFTIDGVPPYLSPTAEGWFDPEG